MRCFISLNFSENDLSEIKTIQDDFKSSIGKDSFKIRWENKDKFHITLFFLGEIPNEKVEVISEKLNNIVKFTENEIFVETEYITAFPNVHNPRVIVLKLLSPDKKIFLLRDKINSVLNEENIKSDTKFTPHLTLGRVKRDEKIHLNIDKNFISKKTFQFSKFYFMKSTLSKEGAIHDIIKSYNLKSV